MDRRHNPPPIIDSAIDKYLPMIVGLAMLAGCMVPYWRFS